MITNDNPLFSTDYDYYVLLQFSNYRSIPPEWSQILLAEEKRKGKEHWVNPREKIQAVSKEIYES